MKCNKGEYGYIKYRKYTQLLYTIGMAAIGLSIFVLGYFLNRKTSANVFTIAAILMVLPGARFLTGFLVLCPYKSVTKERFDKVSEYRKEGTLLLADLVFTSPQKVMNLDFLMLNEKNAIGLVGKTVKDAQYIQDYLQKITNNYRDGYMVNIAVEEATFFSLLKEKSAPWREDSDRKDEMITNLKAFII